MNLEFLSGVRSPADSDRARGEATGAVLWDSKTVLVTPEIALRLLPLQLIE